MDTGYMDPQTGWTWDDGAGQWRDASGNNPYAPTYTTGLTGRTKQELDDFWAGKGVSIANAGYVPPPATGAGSVKVDADEQAASLAAYLARRAREIADVTASVEGSQAGLNAAAAAAERAENERVLRMLSGGGHTSDTPPVPPAFHTTDEPPPAARVLTAEDFVIRDQWPAPVNLRASLGDEDGGTSPLVVLAVLAVLAAGGYWYMTHGGGS